MRLETRVVPSDMEVCMLALGAAGKNWRQPLNLEPLFITSTLYGSPAAASSFDYGSQIPTTRGTGGYYLSVKQGRCGREPRGKEFNYPTGQGRLSFYRRSSHIDQGMFLALLQRSIPGSHITRTLRLMNRIMSSSDYFVARSAKPLIGGRMERNWTSSVSPFTMR